MNATIDDVTIDKLVRMARSAREHAYAPYSNYRVGAALMASDGRVFTGCNVENAAIGPSVCSERVALFKAVSEGVRDFTAVAVATQNGGSPCGVCRQVLREFAEDLVIIKVDPDRIVGKTTLKTLFPESFGGSDLKENASG